MTNKKVDQVKIDELLRQRILNATKMKNLMWEIEAAQARGEVPTIKIVNLRSARVINNQLTLAINEPADDIAEAIIANTPQAPEVVEDPVFAAIATVSVPVVDDTTYFKPTSAEALYAAQAVQRELTKASTLSLREQWDDVYVDDPMMLNVKRYFCNIVLRKKPGSIQMSAAEWEAQYGIITKQISNGLWIDSNGRPSQPLDTRPLFGDLVDASGIVIEIRGNKAHISTRMKSSHEGGTRIHTPIGWTSTTSKVIIPAEWLTPQCVFGIMYGLKWHRTSVNTWDKAFTAEHKITKSTGADILADGAFLYKLLVVARNRMLFKGFMDNRANGGQLCFDIAYTYGARGDGKRPRVYILPKSLTPSTELEGEALAKFKPWHKYPNREELTNMGGYVDGGENNVYLMQHEGRLYTSQSSKGIPNVKKANARVTKLVIGGRSVAPVGRKVIFIAEDVPVAIHDLLILGNALVKASEFERVGPARLLSQCSDVKGTWIPWDLSGTGADMITCKSSWKSGGNGILSAKGTSPAEQIIAQHNGVKVGKKVLFGKEALEALLKKAKKTKITLRGNKQNNIPTVTLSGWFVQDDIFATNLYATYGMRTVKEMHQEDAAIDTVNTGSDEIQVIDSVVSGDNEQEQNGFFAICQRGLNLDPENFNVMQARAEALESGAYVYKSPKTQIKTTDFMSAVFSYGQECAYKLIDAAIEQHMGLRDYARKACQRVFLLGHGADIPTVEIEVLAKLAAKVWVGAGGVKVHPEPGNFNSNARFDENHTRWSWLVDGDATIGWPGLKHHKGMNIVKHTQDETFTFFIPPWTLFEKHLVEELDVDVNGKHITTRCLGEAWTHLIVLIRAIYAPNDKRQISTDWVFSQANHMMNVNRIVLCDVMNKINVVGRYYVIAPRWWSKDENVITCTDKLWVEVDEVLAIKQPALFFDVVANMFINRELPRGWVQFSPNMLAALSLCAFVPVSYMLKHQDDCDGDTICVMNLGKIAPIWTSKNAPLTKWNASYEAGEKDLKLTVSEYVAITANELHDGVLGAAKGKSDTGIMTANLFNVMYYISVFLRANPTIKDMHTLALIKNAYATAVQDEAVRQIKQDTTAGSFFEFAALYKHADEDINTAATHIAAAIIQRIEVVFGVKKGYDKALIAKVVHYMVQRQRRDGVMKSPTVDQKKIEAYRRGGLPASRASLLFTRSYWKNACTFAPQFMAFSNTNARNTYWSIQELEPAALFNWVKDHPVLYKNALAAGWADEFKNSDDIEDNFYAYNRWIYEDGADLSQFIDTCQGYLLLKLRDAYNADTEPPLEFVKERVDNVNSKANDLVTQMQAQKQNMQPTNRELVTKLPDFFDCDVEFEEGLIVIWNDSSELSFIESDYLKYPYEQARKYIGSIVKALDLKRRV